MAKKPHLEASLAAQKPLSSDVHNVNKNGKKSRFTVVIPKGLHRNFKVKTVQEGTTMGAEVEKFIRQYVGK